MEIDNKTLKYCHDKLTGEITKQRMTSSWEKFKENIFFFLIGMFVVPLPAYIIWQHNIYWLSVAFAFPAVFTYIAVLVVLARYVSVRTKFFRKKNRERIVVLEREILALKLSGQNVEVFEKVGVIQTEKVIHPLFGVKLRKVTFLANDTIKESYFIPGVIVKSDQYNYNKVPIIRVLDDYVDTYTV